MGSRENKEGDSAKFSPKEALRLMRELLAALPGYRPDAGISARSRNELQETIAVLVARLQELSAALDPVRVPAEVLDPSDPQVNGRPDCQHVVVSAEEASISHVPARIDL